MRILCIDTSLGASVALWDSEAKTQVLASHSNQDSRSHAEHLSELVSEVVQEACGCALAKAGIEAVAVGRGPAPFTGLRAGLVTARTIGFALQVPVIGISSLDALARAVLDLVPPTQEVFVATDARRKEVYCAEYRADGPDDVCCLWGPEVGRPAVFANRAAKPGLIVAGAGAALYPQEFALNPGFPTEVEAAVLGRIAQTRLARKSVDELPDTISPLYLRRPDVQPPSQVK
ncbi:tRNA (adenosine(37)-N6)-threonylcarbamoyltransferase complex dimerization subunit type 1 TsaB [Varibaculum vaginae]|uniref:tRNA (adenosine(37)-N6)-threonylcarbamoyltransferase complex dimerization subunit type 1 TsaB n=1 Tax=Varibaculum vaginae TaxID=2364797 RepID=UPI000F091854|nr:tRNA (adenosine(37)-N6)-threonylcarbamoyltransferase complex dimerization subunit type 1 TsaB [Varibaculum vaginae]